MILLKFSRILSMKAYREGFVDPFMARGERSRPPDGVVAACGDTENYCMIMIRSLATISRLSPTA